MHACIYNLSLNFLQALERKEMSTAVSCLRKQLAGASPAPGRLHRLAACMLAATPAELQKAADWPGAGVVSRRRVVLALQV